jgi:predicted ATPase
LQKGHEEAAILVDEALQIVERTGERWFAAELNRYKVQLLLRQGHSAPVGTVLQSEHRAKQEAKLWELRAGMSLERLRRDQSHQVEVRDLLAPVYDWFTDGFGTPDLKEAKALLDAIEA